MVLLTWDLKSSGWERVSELGRGWIKYRVLPRFAFAFGTLFNYNSESKRAFSVQTDIHRNPKRNLMLHETWTDADALWS